MEASETRVLIDFQPDKAQNLSGFRRMKTLPERRSPFSLNYSTLK